MTYLQPRDYQIEAANAALQENIIVNLPTGAGKTLIAAMVHEQMRSRMTLVVCASVAVIEQHTQFFHSRGIRNILIDTAAGLKARIFDYGGVGDDWDEAGTDVNSRMLEERRNSIKHKVQEVQLIVFDECHHAIGHHPYVKLAELFFQYKPPGNAENTLRVLGLTASFIHGQFENIAKKRQRLEDNLRSRLWVPKKFQVSKSDKHFYKVEYKEPKNLVISKRDIEARSLELMRGALRQLPYGMANIVTKEVSKSAYLCYYILGEMGWSFFLRDGLVPYLEAKLRQKAEFVVRDAVSQREVDKQYALEHAAAREKDEEEWDDDEYDMDAKEDVGKAKLDTIVEAMAKEKKSGSSSGSDAEMKSAISGDDVGNADDVQDQDDAANPQEDADKQVDKEDEESSPKKPYDAFNKKVKEANGAATYAAFNKTEKDAAAASTRKGAGSTRNADPSSWWETDSNATWATSQTSLPTTSELEAQRAEYLVPLQRHLQAYIPLIPDISPKVESLIEILHSCTSMTRAPQPDPVFGQALGQGGIIEEIDQTLVFVERAVLCIPLAQIIQAKTGRPTRPVMGVQSMSAESRTATLQAFKAGRVRIIVATSSLEEGIDVADCKVVVRFDYFSSVRSHIQGSGRARHPDAKIFYFEQEPEIEEHKATLMTLAAAHKDIEMPNVPAQMRQIIPGIDDANDGTHSKMQDPPHLRVREYPTLALCGVGHSFDKETTQWDHVANKSQRVMTCSKCKRATVVIKSRIFGQGRKKKERYYCFGGRDNDWVCNFATKEDKEKAKNMSVAEIIAAGVESGQMAAMAEAAKKQQKPADPADEAAAPGDAATCAGESASSSCGPGAIAENDAVRAPEAAGSSAAAPSSSTWASAKQDGPEGQAGVSPSKKKDQAKSESSGATAKDELQDSAPLPMKAHVSSAKDAADRRVYNYLEGPPEVPIVSLKKEKEDAAEQEQKLIVSSSISASRSSGGSTSAGVAAARAVYGSGAGAGPGSALFPTSSLPAHYSEYAPGLPDHFEQPPPLPATLAPGLPHSALRRAQSATVSVGASSRFDPRSRAISEDITPASSSAVRLPPGLEDADAADELNASMVSSNPNNTSVTGEPGGDETTPASGASPRKKPLPVIEKPNPSLPPVLPPNPVAVPLHRQPPRPKVAPPRQPDAADRDDDKDLADLEEFALEAQAEREVVQ
ncbi:unnamed protein product [Amoebophrya sp. A25]|nr:unnamed protein product [Amoebophrya sp. A25]|eukprot:GSA25T00002006001.1